MPLSIGTRLEHYEILGPLGAGGMGEVYRAVDTKLRREVAIKILPRQFESDPSRLARFEREAHLLASLNHPHVAAIYAVEHSGGVRFLVLELVEGPTLAERLASGPIPVSEALSIAAQICEALEAAHEKGVIHRDLKPANVKLTANGQVKVLDFGLAKLMGEPEPAGDPENSPTLTMNDTRAGIVLGTAPYMSPEQAEGKPVDKRTDVWSFGVVLYEMLSGRRCFEGKTLSHIIVHVIEQEPDWKALPALPEGVRELLGRCLQKDASKRLRDVGDLRLQLQEAASKPVVRAQSAAAPSKGPRRWLSNVLWPGVAAVAIAALALAFFYFRPKPPPAEAVRFEVSQPGSGGSTGLTSVLSISPDGRKLAFVATGADGRTLLWVRSMETLEARPLEGTDDVTGFPFWSPDSRYLVFGTLSKLKKIEATGGPAQTLCDLPNALDKGFWTRDGKIVYGVTGSGLLEVASAGGFPSPITTAHGGTHGFPSLLPDGRHFVYSMNINEAGGGGIYLGSLDAKPGEQSAKRLLADPAPVAYAASPDPELGYLLFVRNANALGAFVIQQGTLMAQPFDPRRLELKGEPVPVAEDVPGASFSASSTGVLVYRSGPAILPQIQGGTVRGQLTWFDRQGHVTGTAGEPDTYNVGITLSPDGTRVAAAHAGGNNIDIWLFEFARGVPTRFTFDPARDVSPVWSPDSSRIVFVSFRGGSAAFYRHAANMAGNEELLFKPSEQAFPSDWSRDGRFLLFYAGPSAQSDIWVLPMDGASTEEKAVPLVKTEYNERGARFSPDGRWFSYTSNENGKDEAYVRPFDPSSVTSNGGQFMVSKGGGQSPHWRGDGKELFYQAPDGAMMSVEVTTSPVFKAGVPQPLFKGPAGERFWDVTPDGKKFLMPVPQGANTPAPYKVVLNWTAILKK
jgi:serine/threonine protein kinase/Tol biopolymer transport system component